MLYVYKRLNILVNELIRLVKIVRNSEYFTFTEDSSMKAFIGKICNTRNICNVGKVSFPINVIFSNMFSDEII